MINETISVDAGPAISELDALAGAAEGAAAKIDAAFKSIKVPSLGGSGAGNMARSMEAAAAKMEASVGKMEASFAKLGETSKAASASLGDAGKVARESAAGLGDAAKGANDAAASYARLGKTAGEASVAMDEQAVAGKRAAKSSAEGAAASEGFFSKHKELILGTGLALGYAVDKAMKFNASMTLLQTQAGVSAQQMPQLTKGVLELAGQVGQSPGNLAESLYHVESNMSSLGIKAPQALHMVKVAAEGASVGHASLVDTTNALTAAVASGIPGVKSYDQAMGVLNATVGAGDMSMQDLADAMGTGALAVVKGYGANIKDAGAALAVFGDNNIRGATAGTELRMSVQALAVPAASAKKELAGLGLTTGTLAKTMQDHGMLAALEQLNTKFKEHGVTAKNEGQVLTDLFGKKAGVGLAILMEQMGRLESKYPELTRGANEFGKAWDKTLQTPQQKLNNLVQGTQALAITAGNVLMPYANKALGGIDAGLGWLQSHAMASKGLALGAGALVVGGIGKGLFSGVESSLAGLGKIGSALKIPGLDKLANLGSAGASGSLTAVATSGDAAAAALSRLAGVAGEQSVAGAPGAIAGRGAAAAEEEAAAAGGLGSILKTGAGGVMAGGLVAAIAVPLAMQADKALQQHLGNTQGSGYAQIGVGAAAGAATGAAIGSVIPGLGTAVGAIAGALVGGVTTALKNPRVWDEIAGAPKPPGKPTAVPAPRPVWQLPGTGGHPLPVLKTPPAKNPTIGWVAANMLDNKRHATAAGFDRARHDSAAAADWIGGSFDTTRHQAASLGQGLAELFGYRPPPKLTPALPQAAPHQWQSVTGTGGYYPNGQPFFGEVPQKIPVAPAIRTAPGKLAALSMPAPKPIKIPPPDLSAVTAVKAKLTADVSNVSVKPIKIPAPDMSAVGAAKGKLAALSQVTIKAPKMPAPDMSALDGAKGKAASAGSGITQAIQGAMHPAKMPPPNLSAASGAAGRAQGIGASISAGLAAGIRSGIGAITAAAAAAASAASAAMAGALQVRSPSKVTEKIGKDTVAGLVLGLQGGQAAVTAAANAIGKSIAKASDIQQIDSTVKKLLGDVPKGDTGLTALLKVDNAKLDTLAQKRAQLETEITDAGQIASSAISGASIMNATSATSPAGNEPQSWQNIVQGMQNQADTQTQFTAAIGDLKKKGLNPTELNQLVQAGASAGLPIAQGIDQGGKQAISQLNAIQGKIKASASKLGSEAAPSMYQAGKDLTSGIAAGLKAELSSVDKAMEKIAKSMTADVEKVAKTTKAAAKKAGAGAASGTTAAASSAASSGPATAAKAAAGAGKDSLAGAAAGLSAAGSALTSAAAALTSAASALKGGGGGSGAAGSGGSGTPHFPVAAGGGVIAHPVAPSGGGYGGGGGYLPSTVGQHVHYHQAPVAVHVAGNVMTERDLLNTLQEAQLNRSSNNWQSGWQLPGHPN